jgi:hypothetical protein
MVCANPLAHKVGFNELSSSWHQEGVAVITYVEEFRERNVQKARGEVGGRRCGCVITKRPDGTISKPLEQEVEEGRVEAIKVQLWICRHQGCDIGLSLVSSCK